MMQTTDMANERPHQFKIMLSDQEKAWLEELATRRGLTSSDVLRQYIREAHGELRAALANTTEDDFRWADQHADIMSIVVRERDPISTDDISTEMHGGAFHWDATWGGLGLALNQLTRNGYLRRLKTGYVITPKGKNVAG
jgi:hypothetical protein